MPHRRGRDLPPPTSDQRLANERARIVQGTPAKLLPQAEARRPRARGDEQRRPHPSNAGRKNTGLSRTITITLSPRLGREKAAARGKVENPGVTTALCPKPLGKSREVRTLRQNFAAADRHDRRGESEADQHPPHSRKHVHQSVHRTVGTSCRRLITIAHEDGVGETQSWQHCEGGEFRRRFDRVPAGEGVFAEAARLLRGGELIAFPTETVYGLGADATNDPAVARIFSVKARPRFNPLIVHVTDLAIAQRLADFHERARALAERFWPGPLTMVLRRREDAALSLLVSAGLDTVAVRVPDHPVARALLIATGRPIAAPSANVSGRISPTTAAHVAAELEDRVSLIPTRRLSCRSRIDRRRPLRARDGAAAPRRRGRRGAGGGRRSDRRGGNRAGAITGDAASSLRATTAAAAERDACRPPRPCSASGRPPRRPFSTSARAAISSKPRPPVRHAARAGRGARLLRHRRRADPEQGLGLAINDRLRRAAAPPDAS